MIRIHIINAENLEEESKMYCQLETSAMRNRYLIGKTKVCKEMTSSPSWDPDERFPISVANLRARNLYAYIFRKNFLVYDDLLYTGKVVLIDQPIESDISIELRQEFEDEDGHHHHKKKTPKLNIKILPPTPITKFSDWHPVFHHIYACISFSTDLGYSRLPVATLDLLSVNSDKAVVRMYGSGKKRERWIKYDTDPKFLGINGPTHVIRICHKRAPKQVFIPLVTVCGDYKGDITVTFFASSKEVKTKDLNRAITDSNKIPAILQEDTLHTPKHGVYALGHILMQDPEKALKFVPHQPRMLEDKNYIEFARHYGPNVFNSTRNWTFYDVEERPLIGGAI